MNAPDEGYEGPAFVDDDAEEVARLRLFSSYYLFRAIENTAVRCVDRILAEQPELVNVSDRYGDYPIHACDNRSNVALVLLRRGASVDALVEGDPEYEYYNRTALDKCDDQLSICRGGDLDVPRFHNMIRVLIDHGAYLPPCETTERRRWTPFTRTYYTARQNAFLARRDAAVALYLAQGARHPWAPRDMLRELARVDAS